MGKGVLIRALVAEDFADIIRLNDAEAESTSEMDLPRLEALIAWSAYARVAEAKGAVVGFVLAMDAGSAYPNPNLDWFRGRCASFLYVDRIVVAAAASGQGVGRALYADLFAFARSHGIPAVTCEYNLVPPNPGSAAFHAKLGFAEAGTQWLNGGAKKVSMQLAVT